jgi:hypothetical protein
LKKKLLKHEKYHLEKNLMMISELFILIIKVYLLIEVIKKKVKFEKMFINISEINGVENI